MANRQGLLPFETKGRFAPVVGHCRGCTRMVIFAWDDRFPNEYGEQYRRRFNLDPVSANTGHAVLWFETDDAGQPVSRQFFTRINDIGKGYAGPTWMVHQCAGKAGAL